MQTSDKPSLIPVPFANSGTKNTIPTTASPTPGLASLTTGFPPATMTPIVAGGIPPAGADFNGILFLISAASRWANAGGTYGYDSSFSSSIGGYPKGAVLLNAAASGFWMSTAENNTTNPDTGGAGWIDPLAGRLLRTTVYRLSGGVLQSSVNGAPFANVSSTFNSLTTTKGVDIEVVAGGAAGGGGLATNASQICTGSGGGAGGYSRGWYASGFSTLAITVGTGGVGAVAANGGAGGASSVGSLISATGGSAGLVGTLQPAGAQPQGLTGVALGGLGSGGQINVPGGIGFSGVYYGPFPVSGKGGQSFFAEGAAPVGSGVGGGNAAAGYGAGGSGGNCPPNVPSGTGGGGGFSGVDIIREYA